MKNDMNVKAENGYVVLPIERYNCLLAAAIEAKACITLEEEYGGQVAVKIDKSYIYDVAKKLYKDSEFNTPDRKLKSLKDFTVYNATLTEYNISETNE